MTADPQTRPTSPSNRWAIAPRVLAGAPLVFFGIMHLLGNAGVENQMAMRPLVEAAGLPAPAIAAWAAPLAQLVAGGLLLAGAYARIGALLAIGTMAGAVVTHIRVPSDGWPISNGGPEEPQVLFALAVAIIALAGMVFVTGAGRWSVDARAPKHA